MAYCYRLRTPALSASYSTMDAEPTSSSSSSVDETEDLKRQAKEAYPDLDEDSALDKLMRSYSMRNHHEGIWTDSTGARYKWGSGVQTPNFKGRLSVNN